MPNTNAKKNYPNFLLKDRLPKGEFRKTDEDPMSVDQSTRADEVEEFPSDASVDWADKSRREQEKKQRG